MFKKLRNRLLIVNTLILAALVLGSFSVIYVTTWQNTMRNVDMKLERAMNFASPAHRMARLDKAMDSPPQPDRIDNGAPPDMPGFAPEEGGNNPFSLTFTVICDSEGNIEKTNMPFEMTEDFYSDKISEIIKTPDVRKTLKSDNGYWAYKAQKTDSGYVTAFTEINSEQTILRNLLLILSLVALAALAAAFGISLFSANRSIKPVEESYNKQKQFVADASHELKTPLTTINTNVDVLMSHEDSTIRDEMKWLTYIKTETERMTKLTNDLLYLARLDHSDGSALLAPVSFSEAAESVILLMEAVVFEKDVQLDYDIVPEIMVNGNSEQLKQLVMILVDNAIKYTPKKGSINIKLRREASDAVFTIRNTGEGIGEEALEHIFERFYREDKSRARESGGYGLGLAIAGAITETYKGTITAESEKDKYTKFTVSIPLCKAAK